MGSRRKGGNNPGSLEEDQGRLRILKKSSWNVIGEMFQLLKKHRPWLACKNSERVDGIGVEEITHRLQPVTAITALALAKMTDSSDGLGGRSFGRADLELYIEGE